MDVKTIKIPLNEYLRDKEELRRLRRSKEVAFENYKATWSFKMTLGNMAIGAIAAYAGMCLINIIQWAL
jgi:hypothetical protein